MPTTTPMAKPSLGQQWDAPMLSAPPPPMQKRKIYFYATMAVAKSSSKPFVLPNLLFLAISSMVIPVANAYTSDQ
jgi:hypothetical protein